MAFERARQFRAIREFINEIVLPCELIVRNGATGYRIYTANADALVAASAPPDQIAAMRLTATNQLKRSVQTPGETLSRMRQHIVEATLLLGTQAAALAYIDATLLDYHNSLLTRAEIVTNLNDLKLITDACETGVLESGWTEAQVATYIETNVVVNNDKFYSFRVEPDYSPRWQ